MLWTPYLVNYLSQFFSFFLFFVCLFVCFLFFHLKHIFLFSHLLNFLCLFEIKWNSYLSFLKGCPCVGASIYNLHVSSGFCGMAVSEVSITSSPRVCWQLSPWWEVGLEMEGVEPERGVSQGFFSAQWATPTYQRQGRVQAGFVPSKCAFSPSQQWHLHPRGEQCWSRRGQGKCLAWAKAHARTVPACQSLTQLPIHHLCECQ